MIIPRRALRTSHIVFAQEFLKTGLVAGQIEGRRGRRGVQLCHRWSVERAEVASRIRTRGRKGRKKTASGSPSHGSWFVCTTRSDSPVTRRSRDLVFLFNEGTCVCFIAIITIDMNIYTVHQLHP